MLICPQGYDLGWQCKHVLINYELSASLFKNDPKGILKTKEPKIVAEPTYCFGGHTNALKVAAWKSHKYPAQAEPENVWRRCSVSHHVDPNPSLSEYISLLLQFYLIKSSFNTTDMP